MKAIEVKSGMPVIYNGKPAIVRMTGLNSVIVIVDGEEGAHRVSYDQIQPVCESAE